MTKVKNQKKAGGTKKTNKSGVKVEPGDVTVTIKWRRDKNDKHPHVIVKQFTEKDKFYNEIIKNVSVGLTSDKYKGKKHTNIELKKNPLGKPDKSYMRRQGEVHNDSSYSGKEKGVVVKEDYEKVKKIGEKAEKKYQEKKKNKKK